METWTCAAGPEGGLNGFDWIDGELLELAGIEPARGPMGMLLPVLLCPVGVVAGGGMCLDGPALHPPRFPPRGVPYPLRETYPRGPDGGTVDPIS